MKIEENNLKKNGTVFNPLHPFFGISSYNKKEINKTLNYNCKLVYSKKNFLWNKKPC